MYKQYIKILLAAILLSGCSKFDEINTDPNKTTIVTSEMLATTLLLDVTKTTFKSGTDFMRPHMLGKYTCWSSSANEEQYNRLGRTEFFDRLVVLNNIDKMISLATSPELKNSYTALGHTLRAWRFFELTMQVGDIPYSQAMKGEKEGIIKPDYDKQKDVFLGILQELDKADSLFEKGVNFGGDPVYGGNTLKWRKLVNTFQLKVLINLYRKTADTDLKVIARFQEIMNGQPLFEGNEDNFQLKFFDKSGEKYPFYKEGNQSYVYIMLSSVIVDSLKSLQDRRLFYYTNPSPVKIEGGMAVNDWNAYIGLDPSMLYSNLTQIAGSRDYSTINDRYLELPTGEPIYLLSYAELKFMQAEAAVRGWIPGDAAAYYNAGVTAAFKFVTDNTPDEARYHHNMQITNDYVQNSYLKQPAVVFAGTTDLRLKQIFLQKYLSTYLQDPNHAFYEYRRTGYPVFPVNPASNMNIPSDKIPSRWMYPQKELDFNSTHLSEALQRQYGNDDVNGQMWLLKAN